MLISAVKEQPTTGISTHAIVPKGPWVLLIKVRNALVMSEDMSHVALDLPIFALIGDVEGRHSQ